MKKCSECKIVKDHGEFAKRSSSKDGLDSMCLLCKKERSKLYRDKIKSENANKNIVTVLKKVCTVCRCEKDASCFGRCLTFKDGLRYECYDCRNLKARHKYITNLDFRKGESVRFAKMYLDNRDVLLERAKKWSALNPDKKVAQTHRRRAKLYGQIDFDLPINFIDILREKQNDKCAYCLVENVKLTIDHMVPLSRGGKHCFDNIVLSCQRCNSSKNSKTLLEWLLFNNTLQSEGINSDVLVTICNNIIKLMIILENKKKVC
jgi:hypothetical protein